MSTAIYDINEEAYYTQYKIFKKFNKDIIFLLDSKKHNFQDKKILNTSRLSNSEIAELLRKKNIKKVIFFTHRFSDIFLASELKKNNIKTIYIQHGYYEISAMKRTFSGFLNKADKIQLFLKRIFTSTLSLYAKTHLISNLVNHWIILRPFLKNFDSPYDAFYVFDDHWKNYHIETYQAKEKKIFKVGSIDIFEKFNIESKHNKPCYVCQSLVEDGRISKEDLESSLYSIKDSYNLDEIFIKFHPRSKKDIYLKIFPNLEEVNKIPNSKLILGHYSSLLINARKIGLNVEIVNLKNHKIPKSFLSVFNASDKYEKLEKHPYKKILDLIK